MAEDIVVDEPTPPAQTVLVSEFQERHSASLLEQFYLTLSVTYLASPRVERSPVHAKIDRLFDSPHSWRNAYEIEQLLCFVMTDEQLATELERRLAEAKALQIQYVDTIDKELHKNADKPEAITPGEKRIILHRLLNDLQWFYTKRVQHRAAGKRFLQRVSVLFIASLITLFLVLFIQFFAHGGAQGRPQPAPGAAEAAPAGGQAAPGGGEAAPGAGADGLDNPGVK